MHKFSIIVPVFNVADYLKQCLDSIIAQSYQNFEVILVDDGSTDKSGQICDIYSSKYKNFRVIRKNNGGLSQARNYGIEEAKGEYVVFIDSDDYIEQYSLEKFLSALSASKYPEVLITRIKRIYSNSEKCMDENFPIDLFLKKPKDNIINWMFTKSNNLWPSVRYIVKRSLIDEKKMKFREGYFHEDIDWTAKLFLYANTFTATKYYWYNHRMARKGSITTRKNPKRTLDIIELVSNNIKDTKYQELDLKARNVIFQRFVKSIFSSISDCRFYEQNEIKEILDLLKRNQEIFIYTVELRHKLFIIFGKCFGLNNALKIMNVLHR